MAILGREHLRNQLRKREFAPVYLLFGEETFLRDLAAKTIADLLLVDVPAREFNETDHNLNESDLGRALADAEQLPMMASKRVVIISNVVIPATGRNEKIEEEEEAVLARYLDRPSESSVVIFVAKDIDKRRKISKLLIERSVAVEFKRLSEWELINWAKNKLTELNASADNKALNHLVGLVGDDLRKLSNEIEKLAAAALPDKLITYELVSSLVAHSREIENFALTNNLAEKNRSKTLAILKKILDDGAEPVMLLGLIASHFRRLSLAKEKMSIGTSEREVMGLIRLPASLHSSFLTSARRADSDELSRILLRLAEADISIKTSKGGSGKSGARLQIEMLVCELLTL